MNIYLERTGKSLPVRQHELFAYFGYLFSQPKLPENKFIIFTLPRTGSTLLADLLNSHPQIFVDDELFCKFAVLPFKKILFPYWYINSQATKKSTKVYGFDFKVDQFMLTLSKFHNSPENFIQRLHICGWKIIYLHRHNILKRVISDLKAHIRKTWHLQEGKSSKLAPVYIDCQQLRRKLKKEESLENLQKKLIHNIPHLEIIYENHLLKPENHQNTLNIIFNYLELPEFLVETTMKKTSLDNIFTDIINHQEVIKFIKKTKYAKFLID